ncbi:MAG: peptidoglycan editing factor PgeF [Lachnospiraceae bacterium]|nr:peptidoglycan editing factor PgeF [Lachnospiraceae bacterium]
MKLDWNRKTKALPIACKEGDVPYLYFPLLEETGLVVHGFSTKLGGVSEGCYATMNLRVNSEDERANVVENYRRIGAAIGFDVENVVLSDQTHTTNIRVVTEADAGKGLFVPKDYEDIDGLITNVPGLTLATFYADCVPLYFVDPVHGAIGLSHSGWRGTVNQMGACTVAKMQETFGSDPADLLVCIGPSICQDCYEVSEDVAEAFQSAFPQWQSEIVKPGAREGKYQLDLWKTNERILLEAGIRPEHLAVTNICTKCNSDLLYSHRVMGSQRGNLAAFLGLKSSKQYM